MMSYGIGMLFLCVTLACGQGRGPGTATSEAETSDLDSAGIRQLADANFTEDLAPVPPSAALDATALVTSRVFPVCTGAGTLPSPPAKVCFVGPEFGVTLSAVLEMVQEGAGNLSFVLSWGKVKARCPDLAFTHQGQILSMDEAALDLCLPETVKLGNVRYCSDQNNILLEFSKPISLFAYLPIAACASVPSAESLIQSFDRPCTSNFEDCLDRGCTGDNALAEGTPICFATSRFAMSLRAIVKANTEGEANVTFSLNWFSVDVNCSSSLKQMGQDLVLDKEALNTCLPAIVQINWMKYCPDQGDILLVLSKPATMPVYLSSVRCSDAGLVAPSSAALPPGSNEKDCSGERILGQNSPGAEVCYAGAMMRLRIWAEINMNSTTGEGKAALEVSYTVRFHRCEAMSVTQAGQMLMFDPVALKACLRNFRVLSATYCPDQDRVMLTVKIRKPAPAAFPLERVTCPSQRRLTAPVLI
ncbi:unnamed protein product [Polarella glacialis]|uniref:Uncharacterized protein n=1 Tax=Polarella glacialis TaxID=89957 RepID=A0A813DCJ5_POLGL|nr:unnamed protein product [Polarella glacialis]